jgi:hypothetical protein
MRFSAICLRLTLAVPLMAVAALGANLDSLRAGPAELQSAGPLAFGPEGILIVGDSVAGALVALDTNDRTPAAAANVDVKSINVKIAAALGTTPDQIMVNDVAVNPISRKIYLSVSRGRGPDAFAVILRVDSAGNLSELELGNIPNASVRLPDPPANMPDDRGRNPRMEAITDLAFVDGRVIVAGLSNEEFSSTLSSIPFPFQKAEPGAGIEIFHGSHGRFETNAPIRTFVPYEVAGQPSILAAYTCTPLVQIPLSEIQPGNRVQGKTIAEMGNRNRPLDMITYSKDGKPYFLMANSSRGVMKVPAGDLDAYSGITAETQKAGVPYETIEALTGVMQLDKYDDSHAVLLTDSSGSLELRTVALP